jgi:hypothetical protein
MILNINKCMAGIATDYYSQVQQFLNRAVYEHYYDTMVDIGDIGVESFATRVQEMLVDYLRDNYSDTCAAWFRDFWSSTRGRMCLVYSRYACCNKNMEWKSYGVSSRPSAKVHARSHSS